MGSTLYKTVTVPSAPNTEQPVEKMYRGFSTVSTSTENWALYDRELIKQDLINHFHIRQGERLHLPTFGTIIWEVLFEPLTDELKDLIVQDINQIIGYDPRIRSERVIVSSYDQGLQIECQLYYVAYNMSETIKLRFDQAAGILAI